MAEVVGGAKTTAQKSSFKNLSRLWEEVSREHYMEHTGSKRHVGLVGATILLNFSHSLCLNH